MGGPASAARHRCAAGRCRRTMPRGGGGGEVYSTASRPPPQRRNKLEMFRHQGVRATCPEAERMDPRRVWVPAADPPLRRTGKFWAYVVSGRLLAQAVLCLGSSTPWTAPGGHLQLPRDEPFHVRSVNEAARARRARWASTPAAPPEGSPRATAVCSSVSCASTVQIRTR